MLIINTFTPLLLHSVHFSHIFFLFVIIPLLLFLLLLFEDGDMGV